MENKITAEKAFEKFSDMVYRLAFARVKNKFDADDILQEVFLRYIKAADGVENEEHAKFLLIRITINCSKSHFLSVRRRKTQPLDENYPCYMPVGDTLDAVLRLPLKYRTVVHLHYYCGYSVNEISEILSVKPSTIKSQLFRAREKLKIETEGALTDV